MMILYPDTSAYVKLYINEPGADAIRQAVMEATAIYTHMITYAEIRAALAKAVRIGRTTAAELAEHKKELEADWDNTGIVMPEMNLIRRAGDLAEQFGLRGYDSVHLAAAESLHTAVQNDLVFACFDDDLSRAAKALGLGVFEI